jgi:hypothetical protein
LIDVHARAAAGEKNDALAAQRPQDQNLGLPFTERACDRPAERSARLTGSGHRNGGRDTRT